MIAALIRWSARNVFLVLLGTVFIVGAGVVAVKKLPLDALRIDRAARARYLEKFVGPDDDSASARLMDRIAACVDGGRHDDPIASAARAGEGAG